MAALSSLDLELRSAPEGNPLTDLCLFVCTSVGKLENVNKGVKELTEILCREPHGGLLAINSNFGHACQPGYDHLIKRPKTPPPSKYTSRNRARRLQGDGTCFHSSIEPIFKITHPGISENKIYKIKCFPTTGQTQIPGVICQDLSDGEAVLRMFVDYLNEVMPGQDVQISSSGPNMLDYKFSIIRKSPRILINLTELTRYFHTMEAARETAMETLTQHGFDVIMPPFPVRETKPPNDDVKVSFKFQSVNRCPRVNIFQSGKINILGANTVESSFEIYNFFVRLFSANWNKLVALQPKNDAERRAPQGMTNEECNALLEEYGLIGSVVPSSAVPILSILSAISDYE